LPALLTCVWCNIQKVKLGKEGIVHKYGVGQLSESEQKQLEAMKPQLILEIQKGTSWTV
jgi:hypothetical protein